MGYSLSFSSSKFLKNYALVVVSKSRVKQDRVDRRTSKGSPGESGESFSRSSLSLPQVKDRHMQKYGKCYLLW